MLLTSWQSRTNRAVLELNNNNSDYIKCIWQFRSSYDNTSFYIIGPSDHDLVHCFIIVFTTLKSTSASLDPFRITHNFYNDSESRQCGFLIKLNILCSTTFNHFKCGHERKHVQIKWTRSRRERYLNPFITSYYPNWDDIIFNCYDRERI